MNRVVVTGLGLVSPLGNDIEEFEKKIFSGISGIKEFQVFKDFDFKCTIAGIPDISDKKYQELLKKLELSDADLSIKYSIIASISAYQDSALEIPNLLSENINEDYATIIGTCGSGYDYFFREILDASINKKIKKLRSQTIENIMHSGPAAKISQIFAIANQSISISSACASGTEAIVMGYEKIQLGKADLIIVGGTDPLEPGIYAGFDSMRLIVRGNNETPEQASRPMSATAKGFVPAGGAGILILENLEHAKKRGAKIYAEIVGGCVNCGGQRNGGSMTAQNPEMVVKCIQNAMNEAGIKGSDIDLIAGHLTSTKGDPIEVKNWVTALNLKDKFPYLNSLKSMIGHTLGAAGAIETIAAILQMNRNFVHPSLNSEDLHSEIAAIYPREKIPLKSVENVDIKYVAKASFGFGDVNACVILKKYE